MPGPLEDQLVKYLTDAHSIEEQALVQLRRAPANAQDSELAAAFAEHLAETERHEEIVRRRLEAYGAEPSALKDLAMKAGGVGFVLFARAQPDTPGKLVAHAYSYEHLELGAYELLLRVAYRTGDTESAMAAREILADERRMARRLEACFDRAVTASLAARGVADLGESLRRYLADAHAIEAQSVELLERGPAMAGDPELARLYEEHLAETRVHQELVDERLAALGGSPSALKDAALRLGALHWALFFRSQPDTPGKLAAFAFAFEHLEIAAYEELRLVAERARDDDTVETARRILVEERAAAARLAGAVDRAAEASLQAQGVAATSS